MEPPCRPATSTVQGKLAVVGLVQVPIDCLEDAFIATGVGVRERRTARHHAHAHVSQLAGFGEHGARYLAQGVEPTDHGILHNDEVLPCVEVFYVPLATVLTAEPENFWFVEQICEQAKHRLSDKMSIFVHGYVVLWLKQR